MTPDLDLAALCKESSRLALWTKAITEQQVQTVAEVGVYRGRFAEALLSHCPGISTYYLIDPWRHLENWNKPSNKDDATFDEYFEEAMTRTAPWENKRIVLRGRTTEIIDSISDGSLDLAYVDGDHTLHGISIDLIRTWPKLRPGGLLGGDDFSPTIWQHAEIFEPTLVFPFAVYFAEAVGAPIAALPNNQFLIHKLNTGFAFHDPTGEYETLTLRAAFAPAIQRPQPHSPANATRRFARRLRNGLRHSIASVGSSER
jgi:Methyltransferase domain